MTEPRAGKGPRPPSSAEDHGDPRFRVFGVWLVVRMGGEAATPFAVQCPHGQPMQYGTVVAVGDGFDPDAASFREVPAVGSIVAFEETPEGIEGHYFFDGDTEYRIVHLDAVNISFPPGSS